MVYTQIENERSNIYGTICDTKGSAISAGFLISISSQTTNDSMNPRIKLLEDGNFLVVWQTSTSQIYGQYVDSNGNLLSNIFFQTILPKCSTISFKENQAKNQTKNYFFVGSL